MARGDPTAGPLPSKRTNPPPPSEADVDPSTSVHSYPPSECASYPPPSSNLTSTNPEEPVSYPPATARFQSSETTSFPPPSTAGNPSYCPPVEAVSYPPAATPPPTSEPTPYPPPAAAAAAANQVEAVSYPPASGQFPPSESTPYPPTAKAAKKTSNFQPNEPAPYPPASTKYPPSESSQYPEEPVSSSYAEPTPYPPPSSKSKDCDYPWERPIPKYERGPQPAQPRRFPPPNLSAYPESAKGSAFQGPPPWVPKPAPSTTPPPGPNAYPESTKGSAFQGPPPWVSKPAPYTTPRSQTQPESFPSAWRPTPQPPDLRPQINPTTPVQQVHHVSREQRPPEPTEHWKSGLFDCCDEPTNALITWCVPCVTFGQIAEIVTEGQQSCACAAAAFCGLMICGCGPCYSCGYRTDLRRKFNLKEDPLPDCLTHYLCGLLALCQEYRELKLRGHDPDIGWKDDGSRQQQIRATPPQPQYMHQ